MPCYKLALRFGRALPDARSDVDSNTTDLVADRFPQTVPLDKGFGQTLRSANLRRPTIVRYAS
jgi:hypothetical protein